MWKYLMICLLAVTISCKGSKNSSAESTGTESENTKETSVNIIGQWDIENIVENDSSYVRPTEIEPGITAYIDFKEDNTFGVMTNCNHLSGQYQQNNDLIVLTDVSATEVACDNMAVEDMIKKILPIVNSIDCINDSITRLNSDKGDSYIVLKKRILTLK